MVRSTRVGAGKVEFRMTQIQYIDVLGCDQHHGPCVAIVKSVQTRIQSEHRRAPQRIFPEITKMRELLEQHPGTLV